MNKEIIAKVCHEVNKAFCEAIGDHGQKSWDEADEWQKQSSLKGVEFALTNDTTPRSQHEAWVNEKISAGWRYGVVKDAEKKTDPSIVAFDALPEHQKIKDHLFMAVVNSLKDL